MAQFVMNPIEVFEALRQMIKSPDPVHATFIAPLSSGVTMLVQVDGVVQPVSIRIKPDGTWQGHVQVQLPK